MLKCNIIRIIESRRTRWTGYAALMEKKRNSGGTASREDY
jgi:hypothetical protein